MKARTPITSAGARAGSRPQPPRERLRTRVLPARLPHTIQLCIHCRDRQAGFWVSCTGRPDSTPALVPVLLRGTGP